MKVRAGEVGRFTFEPEWRLAKRCDAHRENGELPGPHFQGHARGQLAILMDDGSEPLAGPGAITSLRSGHDAWVVGDEPAVTVDWFGVRDRAK